jgi:hypothetical protein
MFTKTTFHLFWNYPNPNTFCKNNPRFFCNYKKTPFHLHFKFSKVSHIHTSFTQTNTYFTLTKYLPSITSTRTVTVCGYKTKVLVVWNESEHCMVRRPLWYLPKNQGWTSEASRITATLTNPGLEMGWGRNRFCSGFTQDTERTWLHMGDSAKVAHLLPVRTNYGGEKLARLYMDNIVKLHGVPSRIVSDRETQFTSRFWKSLHKAMGTKLDFSSAYHPQTDGQTERVNQIIEDMLRACVLTYGKDWEQSLPYAEFSYNNGYQASLGMSPFEARYGRKCRTPLMWSEVGERALVGPALIKEAE